MLSPSILSELRVGEQTLQPHHRVCILSGNGDLPLSLCKHLISQKMYVCALGFDGLTHDDTRDRTIAQLGADGDWAQHPIGHIGAILATLKQRKITHIIMAGDLKRPSLRDLSLDWVGTKWMARLGMAAFSGDDTLLSHLMKLMESEGFTILSPHHIIPILETTHGPLTQQAPTAQHMRDIQMGFRLLHALSPFDVGQAVVIRDGYVIGIEAAEGTEQLLSRTRDLLKQTGSFKAPALAPSGVLIKSAKTHQNMRVDVPTLGPNTIEQAYHAGLAGIAVGCGATQIIDRANVLDVCAHYSLFLYAYDPAQLNENHEKII